MNRSTGDIPHPRQGAIVEKTRVRRTPTPFPADTDDVPVADDPQLWSRSRKTTTLVVVCLASLIATLAANVHNPGIRHITQDLHATDSDISFTLSSFVLVQGVGAFLWNALSEVKGRKLVYLVSSVLFIVSSAIIAISSDLTLVIGMRCLQAVGSSAVFSVGAAALADIYEPEERFRKMGIYQMAPSLGPAVGPALAGVLTNAFNWSASYWLLVGFGGVVLLTVLLFYKETYRHERSLPYRSALHRQRNTVRTLRRPTISGPTHFLDLDVVTQGPQLIGSSSAARPEVRRMRSMDTERESKFDASSLGAPSMLDITAMGRLIPAAPTPVKIELRARDINPFTHLWRVLRHWKNLTVLVESGLLYGLFYTISYTTARLLDREYFYNALNVGLVLSSFGLGATLGSIAGYRWSDHIVARSMMEDGRNPAPEMRLRGAMYAMLALPAVTIGYAWIGEKNVHIAAICTILLLIGFSAQWIDATVFAYLVDANSERLSTAVAAICLFRGFGAFVAAETAVPLQESISDGLMYTMWGGLMVIGNGLVLTVYLSGRGKGKGPDRKEKGRELSQ
ncbi:hypothetical protein PLICRDRAFT_43233 [Plicaturopsis crispa FD-325 SS-3]|nr:hypothetical protein PLICRDRAFT_43233 [Plicaturopsis crispa FD-325 SS-3]